MDFKAPRMPSVGKVKIIGRPLRLSGRFGISTNQIKLLEGNLRILSENLTDKTIEVLAHIVKHLLDLSQKLVPHDTGELKSQGTGTIYFGLSKGGRFGYGIEVARGTESENEPAVIRDISRLKGRLNKRVKFVEGEVFYYRFNEEGQDIALWAHEDLNPHGGPSPAVRKPGRQPKYLEQPYSENIKTYLDWISDAFSYNEIVKDLAGNSIVKQTAKGKYEVDLVMLRKAMG